jgi:GT2 family glycosyltransferase
MNDRPSVSILIPAFNEAARIDACLEAVLGQTYPLAEVLVLDGGSTDGTRERVKDYGSPVRLVDNPRRGPAAAMNVGIAVSTGEVICRIDAHTLCEADYVERSVAVLVETRADVVGGPMRPIGTTPFGRAVAAITSTPLGMPGRFHHGTRRVEVDTVYLGAWRRETLEKFGKFDEEHFPWCGEDNELNFRIRREGGRVLLDPDIRSTYFPRESPSALWRQYRNYGRAKATSVAVHGALPSWRPVAPAGLVAAAAVGVLVGRNWRQRAMIPLLHGAGCLLIGVKVTRDGRTDPIRAAAVQEVCHWSYGTGFWQGMARAARGLGVQEPLEASR